MLCGGFCTASSSGNGGEYPMWRAAGEHPRRSRHRNNPGNYSGTKVMLSDFKCGCPVYLACGYTDLRRGIDGLAGLVQTRFRLDPFQNALFLFCGRRKDRIKGLYWEGDGFVRKLPGQFLGQTLILLGQNSSTKEILCYYVIVRFGGIVPVSEYDYWIYTGKGRVIPMY